MAKKIKDEKTTKGSPFVKKCGSTSSVYDSDEEPPAETAKDRLSWRLEPEESLSDWTIEIVTCNNNKTDTYHVHKNQLAVGARKSEYFAKIFSDGGRFAETKAGKSRIEFDVLAAEAFPTLLDYLYYPDAEPHFDTNNVTALHSMAKYFGMRRLRWEAKQFWHKDMSEETCGVYYEQARILQDDKVLDAAANACSDNIMSITRSSRLLHVPDADFWQWILQNQPGDAVDFSCHVSILLVEFFRHNQMDVEMFKKLTSNKLLHHIDVAAALPLIDAERDIVDPDPSQLSSLQKRCIKAISQEWDSIDVGPSSSMMALLKKQNPLILGEILSVTLTAAKTEKKDLNILLSAAAKRAMHLDKSLTSATKKTMDLNNALRTAKREKIQIEKELSGFSRLKTSDHISVGSVDRVSLPQRMHGHHERGANVQFSTSEPTSKRRASPKTPNSDPSYPLFYYIKKE